MITCKILQSIIVAAILNTDEYCTPKQQRLDFNDTSLLGKKMCS